MKPSAFALVASLSLAAGCGHGLVFTDAGDRIATRTRGDGPVVVVVAGGPAAHAPLYDRALEPLEAHARLVYWDYAGTGRSATPTLASMADDVDDLDAVVARHGGHAILLAHSYGTMVALRYAAAHPERVRGLVLVGARQSSKDVAAATQLKKERLGGAAAEWEALRERCHSGCSRDQSRRMMFLDASADLHDRGQAQRIASELQRQGHAVVDRAIGLKGFDARELGPVVAPALIVEGADDALLPSAKALAEQLHAQLAVFDGSGHYPFVEEPARFVAAVDAFVSAIARTTTEAQVSPKAPVTNPAVP